MLFWKHILIFYLISIFLAYLYHSVLQISIIIWSLTHPVIDNIFLHWNEKQVSSYITSEHQYVTESQHNHIPVSMNANFSSLIGHEHTYTHTLWKKTKSF